MKTVLYIHGFNGKAKGGTYDGLVSFFADYPDFQVTTHQFKDLHLDPIKTQQEIDEIIEKENVSVVVGASLGGFYTLSCKKPVFKIAINPCMEPSKEIPLLKDRDSGEPIVIKDDVLQLWKKMEKYDLSDDCKNAFGIFGKQDSTFHYDENHNFKPLFEQCFPGVDNTILVEGVHSLEPQQIAEGMNKAIQFLK